MPPVRHILVTGAGGGLGAAVCDLLARSGDTVFATDADDDRLRLLRAGPAIVRIRMDVTDPRDIERAVTEVAAATDGLDGIVCSAGIFRAGSLVEIEDAAMARSLGDATQDVVYVPVTPCRLVETRGTFAAVYQGGGAFSGGTTRSYTLQGGNGVCLSQLPANATPGAVQLQVFGIPTSSASGRIVRARSTEFSLTAWAAITGCPARARAATVARK